MQSGRHGGSVDERGVGGDGNDPYGTDFYVPDGRDPEVTGHVQHWWVGGPR